MCSVAYLVQKSATSSRIAALACHFAQRFAHDPVAAIVQALTLSNDSANRRRAPRSLVKKLRCEPRKPISCARLSSVHRHLAEKKNSEARSQGPEVKKPVAAALRLIILASEFRSSFGFCSFSIQQACSRARTGKVVVSIVARAEI